jgi:RNA polymerase-associated protein CTR9
MIINIKINERESVDFDTADLPMEEDFESLVAFLSENNVPAPIQHKIAYAYRKHPMLARRILKELMKNTVFEEDINTKLLLLACQLQLGMGCAELIKEFEDVSSPVLDILRGFYFVRLKSYKNALFLFKRAKYPLGMQICHYYLNNMPEAMKSGNETVRAFCMIKENKIGLNELSSVMRGGAKQDILFRLGLSNEYSDPNALDVKITQLEKMIGEESLDEAYAMLEAVEQNAETLYLKAKIEHKRGNLEKAKKTYMESLEMDRGYFKSEYNLQRIVQDKMRDLDFPSREFLDFKAYLDVRNGHSEINVSKCSSELRDVVLAILDGRKGTGVGLERYSRLMNNPWIDDFVVYNNVIYFLFRDKKPFGSKTEHRDQQPLEEGELEERTTGERRHDRARSEEHAGRAEKYLRLALSKCPEEYREIIRYNLAYATDNEHLLEELSLREAKLLLAYKRADISAFTEASELDLVGSYHLSRGELGPAKKIFQKSASLYAAISLGNIYLRSYYKDRNPNALSKAMGAFAKNLSSFYCANGVGICLALKGRLEDAIGVFTHVVADWRNAHINLGNALALAGKYREAIRAFLRFEPVGYTRKMAVLLCGLSEDARDIELCVNAGISELKDKLFGILVNEGRLDEAERLGSRSEKLLGLLSEKRRAEEEKKSELKRKIDEINEYRKRRLGR